MAAISKTPKLHRPHIPHGHVLVNEKWHGSDIVRAIQEQHVKVLYDDSMGMADFYASNDIAIVYLTEADLIGGLDYKAKILKISKTAPKVLVISERTPLSEQYFTGLQKFVVIERSLVLLPMTSNVEAAKIIAQMVKLEYKPQDNPYRIKLKPQPVDKALLNTVQAIPGLGEKKALELLKKFKSIEDLSKAKIEEMSPIIGKSSALHVGNFFHQSFHNSKNVS
ncbi:Fanconi anemia core complex-associated protein 24-like [Actinia tenebrosa]|uniref:Fanconi anemia core complex-associated protein 24-like n=1 Tax=Actinia tenebrosa TaxID=6105 RepID=A0A6P8HIM2_ACTTE|nr:Fanconi anemia core complex-associated protein 24-like [Actinia tenebrosa]